MIITRTPFRITLGGGGTDLPAYYSKYGGFIFAVTLDKYMFINVNKPIIDDLVRLKYSKIEVVSHRDEIEHEMAREGLRMMGIERGIEIDSLADVPAGTGLGSSSCYAVGLLNALHAFKNDLVNREQLAQEANYLEAEILKKPVGKQDHYMAAFGGFTVLDIDTDGAVKVRRANISEDVAEDLNRNILMFYTDTSRSANEILGEQSKSVKEEKKDVVDNMHFIKDLGYKILEAAESGNITEIGKMFHEHWEHKKRVSTKMSNPKFDAIYDTARKNGALGGKISGAGGGGFFTFYVEDNHRKFREVMRNMGLREMKYRFDHEGTKIVANI
ncbi:MAG: galactokinase [Patescibacteria group bacterium]|nr:galactokinase [Patescibacteria group bacterium]